MESGPSPCKYFGLLAHIVLAGSMRGWVRYVPSHRKQKIWPSKLLVLVLVQSSGGI